MSRDLENQSDFASEYLDVLLSRTGRPPWLSDGFLETPLGLDLCVLFEKIYSIGVEDGRRQARNEDGVVRDACGSDTQMLHALTSDLVKLFNWSDPSPLHAVLHVENAVGNLRADLAVAQYHIAQMTVEPGFESRNTVRGVK